MSAPVAIYALADRTGVRYVGKAQSPRQRLAQHLAERGSSPKCRWLEELRLRGERPELRILELVDAPAAAQVELRWIRRLHRRGLELVNVPGTGRPRRPRGAGPRPRRTPDELVELYRQFRVAGLGEVG